MRSPRHPTTLSELRAIVVNQEPESIHLEFKDSSALITGKVDEISKDISAFANSDGGTVIYGITESTDHRATSIDPGLDVTTRNHREWIENKIQSTVSPRLDGLLISEILLAPDRAAYVVSVPASFRGPHQDRKTHRYYRRHNFKAEPMEDYEIRDVRNRRQVRPSLVSVHVDVTHGAMLEFCVENVGEAVACDVRFTFTPALNWKHGAPASLASGIRALPPRRRLAFFYGTGPEVFTETTIVRAFSVDVSYTHGATYEQLSEHFEIDLESLQGMLHQYTDLERLGQTMEKAIAKVTGALEKMTECIDTLTSVAGPTGLTVSDSTLRNVAMLVGQDDFKPKLLDPQATWKTFAEVLEVDATIAMKLWRFFQFRQGDEKLSTINGIDEDVIRLLESRFRVDPAMIR